MSKEEKTKEKKTSDKSKKKKQNRIAKWFKDLRTEFKKVVWPSKKKVLNNTSIVLAVMVVATIFVGGLDFGLLKLFSLLLGLE
jgi:preprotein translocase subunit SecE